MNIKHLNKLTPEWVDYMATLAATGDAFASHQEEFEVMCYDNRDLIIAALHAGLRLKRELEGMTRE